jgi:hypothetical protein
MEFASCLRDEEAHVLDGLLERMERQAALLRAMRDRQKRASGWR